MLPKEEKIKELLRQHGLDGAIVSSPENFHYVTGFAGHQHTVSRQPGFSVAVVSAREDVPTQLTTMDFEVPTFEKKSQGRFLVRKYDTWTGVKVWDEITTGQALPAAEMENSMDVLKKMVKDMDLANKKLGVELDYLTAGYYNSLCQAFPEARYENISDLFVFARSVKTPEEIQMFRTLCRAADEGFTAVSKIARVGVSERELVETFRKTVIATGVAAPSAWSMFSTGEAGARLTIPEENIIRKGDVVKFDAGVNAEFDFYTTDTSRSWVMEGADPTILKLKDRLYEGQRRMIAAAKPGLPMNELFHIAYDYVKEAFPAYRRGHQGHSISMGPATAEAPFINPTTTRPLEAGMVLAMEVPCYIRGVNGFNIEDMVLITEDGCEVLTPATPHYL
ncbi:M24 family metallopeptidase [Candidatus Pseudoscillospira sp. SGI.172]|uniref:M24 family metallopeptidase n=1 Tax=Candidatus Pseudoscillospira sp. SGI.172 TaxID=3420582 RepID=UPI003D04148A